MNLCVNVHVYVYTYIGMYNYIYICIVIYIYIYIWYIYQDGMAWLLDPPEWMIAVHHLKPDELYSQTCENRVPNSTL